MWVRDAPGLTGEVLSGAVSWAPWVESALAGVSLGRVPVAGGSVTWSVRREVPGSLELVVPRVEQTPDDPGPVRDWWPGRDPRHPLGWWGQRLTVSVLVALDERQVWRLALGVFQVRRVVPDGPVVRVSGESLTRVVVDDELEAPRAASGTLAGEVGRLVPPAVGVVVDDELVDRPVPGGLVWGESRIDALAEVCRAWPARLREDDHGTLRVLPPLPGAPGAPLGVLSDGTVPQGRLPAGVDVAHEVESMATEGTRDGVHNVIIARGQDTDEDGRPTIQRVATQQHGPFGTETFGRSVRKWSSPLNTSPGIAAASAATMLTNELRAASTVSLRLAADPRWHVDDPVMVAVDGTVQTGWVSGVEIPLAPGGVMRLDVEVP